MGKQGRKLVVTGLMSKRRCHSEGKPTSGRAVPHLTTGGKKGPEGTSIETQKGGMDEGWEEIWKDCSSKGGTYELYRGNSKPSWRNYFHNPKIN